MEHEIPSVVTYAIVLLVALLAWLGRMYARRLDNHLAECSKRAQAHAGLEQKVVNLLEDSRESAEQVRWVGDCVITIASSMKIHLPDRP